MKSLGVLWLVVFISLMGFGVTAVPFPLVAEQMGATNFWKTFGGPGVFSVFQLLSTPIWGRCSDAFGRKPILVVSLVGSVFAYIWLAYADGLTSLILSRAFGGMMSGNLGAAFAYATDVTEPKNRARGLGIVASAFGLGFAIGPPLGGFLGATPDGGASLHWPALASAGFCLVALIGTIFLLRESLPVSLRKPLRAAAAAGQPRTSRSPLAALATRPALLGLAVAAFVVSLGGAVMQSVYQFWGRDLFAFSLRDVGLQFMAFALLSAVGQAGLVGPLAKRYGERSVALVSVIATTVGLLLFGIATQEWTVWLAILVFGLSNGVFLPSVTSLVSFEADPSERGAVMGGFNAASSFGRVIGPAVSGPVYFSFGHAAPFVLSAVLTALGAALLLRAHGRRSEEAATPKAEPPSI